MDTNDLLVRPEIPADRSIVFEINRLAFGSDAESSLVDLLRKAAEPYISLVAVEGGEVVGHIFFSPVQVESAAADVLCMGLGPMAVRPDRQNCGLGSALVERGLSECRELGVGAVFVLGHPDYYPRFGFRKAATGGLRYKSERFDPFFFVLEINEGFVAQSSGMVRYHPVFDSL